MLAGTIQSCNYVIISLCEFCAEQLYVTFLRDQYLGSSTVYSKNQGPLTD